MTKKEKISAKVKANYIKIDNLNEENRELLRKSYLLSDDKQNFIEKKETSGKGKNKITQLVGRIHWVEKFEDRGTGKVYDIERSRVVIINGEWI